MSDKQTKSRSVGSDQKKPSKTAKNASTLSDEHCATKLPNSAGSADKSSEVSSVPEIIKPTAPPAGGGKKKQTKTKPAAGLAELCKSRKLKMTTKDPEFADSDNDEIEHHPRDTDSASNPKRGGNSENMVMSKEQVKDMLSTMNQLKRKVHDLEQSRYRDEYYDDSEFYDEYDDHDEYEPDSRASGSKIDGPSKAKKQKTESTAKPDP